MKWEFLINLLSYITQALISGFYIILHRHFIQKCIWVYQWAQTKMYPNRKWPWLLMATSNDGRPLIYISVKQETRKMHTNKEIPFAFSNKYYFLEWIIANLYKTYKGISFSCSSLYLLHLSVSRPLTISLSVSISHFSLSFSVQLSCSINLSHSLCLALSSLFLPFPLSLPLPLWLSLFSISLYVCFSLSLSPSLTLSLPLYFSLLPCLSPYLPPSPHLTSLKPTFTAGHF